jgi:N-carbamoylputrescine amidase
MRLTVCELPADMAEMPDAWDRLTSHVRAQESDVVLLPEMPFHRWLAATKEVDPVAWNEAAAEHDRWMDRLPELGTEIIIGSRPVIIEGRRLNEAFLWSDGSYLAAHHKYYLPDEDGFWEATWYQTGEKDFTAVDSPAGPVGLLVCTELWFTEHARGYARAGARIVANPRATEWSSRDKWLAGGRAAAVMSGAFCLSSNRSGEDDSGVRWGGLGWVIDPDGEVLATTSEGDPVATVEVDPLAADRAKATYPRYVAE